MSEPLKKPTHRVTLCLDFPGGANVTTDVSDPEESRRMVEKIVDEYYNRRWLHWLRWRSSWCFIAGTPYVCFPIERLVMVTISELPNGEGK